MILSLSNIDGRLSGHCFIASKNREVHDRLSIASLILRSQSQCRTGNAINLFENVNMIFQLFSASRHLRFEDIQAMVDLIAYPRQISGLLTLCTLDDSLVNRSTNPHQVSILSCNPSSSLGFTIQSVETQAILRCNEASSLPSNEVLFDGFPVYIQGFRHIHSLYSIVHKVNASLNQGIKASVHQLSSVSNHPPTLSGHTQKGGGSPYRRREEPQGATPQKGQTK